MTAEGLRPDPDERADSELSSLVVSSPLTVRPEGEGQAYKFLRDAHVAGTSYTAGESFTSTDDKLAFELIAQGVLEIVEGPAAGQGHGGGRAEGHRGGGRR